MSEDPAQLILDGPPLYCDAWYLEAGLWRPSAESWAHPLDAGPEFILLAPGGEGQPFLYREAIVRYDSHYRHTPGHPLRLEWWRVPADQNARPEPVAASEGLVMGGGGELGVSCGQPILQSQARCHQLRILGPWGTGAVAGGIVLRLAYLDELTPPEPGEVPL